MSYAAREDNYTVAATRPGSIANMTGRGLAIAALSFALVAAAAGCISETAVNSNNGLCGNGVINPGEQCDDGNTIDHDGCSASCQVEGFCGNGVVEPGEECDDGNYTVGDGCDAECNVEVGCGNGRLEIGEECDDGNLTDGDGCDALCQDEVPGAVCGNGIHELGEGCDDGNTAAGDGCSVDCKREDGCGNGTVEAPEMCDDGNTVSGDGCSWECRVEFVCGNGYCEAQNYETCYLCPSDCCPDCGDGVLDPGEECDDGNNIDGDGCDKGCGDEDGVATCGNGIWEAGEECEDGNTTIHDGCSDTCELEFVCGDQVCETNMGENCQRCQMDCCPNCGNGVREIAHGEECDGQELGGHTCDDHCYEGGVLGCTPWCTFDFSTCGGTGPACGDGVAECAEQCDGADLKGKTCQSVGYTSGTLSCAGSCTLDVSGCSGLVWYFNEGFEDPSAVNQEWLLLGDWAVGIPSGVNEEPATAYEGANALGTNIGGDYSYNQTWATNMAISPTIDLTAATDPRLVFQLAGATYDYDHGMNVWITNNGGVDWAVLTDPNVPYDGTQAGQPCWYGYTSHLAWRKVIFDLSAFVGDQIQIGFALASGSYSAYSGMHVDAMLVSEAHMVPVDLTDDPDLGLAVAEQPYSRDLMVDGGTGTYDWSIQPGGTNNAWLSIDPATGTLSGTPLASNLGLVQVIVRAAVPGNPGNFDEETFELNVVEGVWYQNFDAAGHGWTLTSDWAWGMPAGGGPASCVSGSCIGTNLTGDYSPSLTYAGCTATSPAIDLSGATAPTLLFSSWLEAEGGSWDCGNIKVSTNGTTFTVLNAVTPAYNLNISSEQCWGGAYETWASQWVTWQADLSAYAGQTIWLRFSFVSDSIIQYSGWFLDELMILD